MFFKKNYQIIQLSIICLIFVSLLFGIVNVSAATISKTLTASHSTTSINATTKYYTNEIQRWSVGNPVLVSTGGKGGSASKSGAPSTSQSGVKYYVTQSYSVSATDYNYNTTSVKRKLQWCVNSSTNTFVSAECKAVY